MAAVITINGIDEAITNLNYRNEKALKCRLLRLVRDHYDGEESAGSVTGLESDDLIGCYGIRETTRTPLPRSGKTSARSNPRSTQI